MATKRRETPQEKLERLTQIERGLWTEGRRVAGIDEVGRGPLAGPVVTACVCIPQEKLVPGVDDSKKLSEARREALYPLLLAAADYAETCFIGPDVIDDINILNATKRCEGHAGPLHDRAGREVPDVRLRAQQGLWHRRAHRRAEAIRPVPRAPAQLHRKDIGGAV